jgi:nuclear transcription factor Y, alpha
MQNCKMEQNEQQQTSIQVMPTVLGTANGQQILLQSLQQTIGNNGQQSAIQVIPIQALGQGGTIIVQQPQPQIVQLPDGQTFIYQPMIPETTAQPQIVNINGNFFQIPAQQPNPATATTQTTPQAQPTQQPQVVMMANPPAQTQPVSAPQTQQNDTQNTVTSIINTTATSPPPQTSSPAPQESEEEPLYVNASKLFFLFSLKFLFYSKG